MRILVLVSDGLQTRRWAAYLPQVEKDVFCEGTTVCGSEPLTYGELPKNADAVWAFWNGSSDLVDRLVYMAREEGIPTHVFLPNEEDDGFEKYIPANDEK